MKKKLLSLALVLALCIGLTVPALSYDSSRAGMPTVICDNKNNVAFIDANGILWMSGGNHNGQLGIGSREDISTPAKVTENVASISLGDGHTAAIKADHSLWMWGNNTYGQLGNGGKGNVSEDAGGAVDEAVYQTVPAKVMDDVAAVSCGNNFTAAIKTDGSLWMWGINGEGQLGNGRKGNAMDAWAWPYQTVPVKVMDDVTSVSCSGATALAVKKDGSLWAWGGIANYLDGSISGIPFKGNGSIITPVKVMDGVASAYCGPKCSAAVKTDGSLWMWGHNRFGQVGNGLEGNYKEPIKNFIASDPPIGNDIYQTTPVKVLDNVVAVNFGTCKNDTANSDGTYTTAITTDGSLWVWGEVEYFKTKPTGTVSVPLRGLFDVGSAAAMPVPAKIMDGVAAVAGNYVVKNGGSIVTLAENVGWTRNFTVKTSNTPSIPPTPTVGGFTDVKKTDYYSDAVLWAVEQKITSGTSKTTFSPGATCNRAQILSFLWRASGSPEPTISNPFTDIKATDYYYKAALWAAEKGMVSGTSFGGSTPCTRASTMEYMWKAAGSPAASYDGKFDDVPASADYAQAVAWALENGVTSGTSKTTFGPASTCTRGQIVTFLHRAMGK